MFGFRASVVALAVLAGSGVPAAAQAVEWQDRAFLDVNASVQLNGRPFTDGVALTIVSYPVAKGPLTLDVGGGLRVWRSLGIGAGFTKFAVEETAAVRGIDPVPVQHVDSVLHVAGMWVRPLSERMDLAISGGPSFMNIQQDLVTTFAGPVVARITQRTIGLHASGNLTYFVTRMVGIGTTIRYLRGSADLERGGGATVTTFEATGWQVGAGARLRMR